MSDAKQGKHPPALKEEIICLGPWHHDVQVTPEISTSVFLEAPEGTYSSSPSFINPLDLLANTMRKVYPEGLEGRTFLDCACNAGGYSYRSEGVRSERVLRIRRQEALDRPGTLPS